MYDDCISFSLAERLREAGMPRTYSKTCVDASSAPNGLISEGAPTAAQALDWIFPKYPICPVFDYVGTWIVRTPDFCVSKDERDCEDAFMDCVEEALNKALDSIIKK